MAEGKSFAPQLRTFYEILLEFKKKIVIILVLLLAGSVIGYLNTTWLMAYLFERVGTVIFTTPAEGFMTQLKLAFTIGLILTLPLIIYIIANFLRQKYPQFGSKNLLGFIALSYALFIAGMMMAFFMIFPLAIKFLLGFSTESLAATLTASSYIGFVIVLCMAFGFAFQLPIIINLLTKSGLVSSRALISKRKYMIVIIFTLAAFITPPDVISQICLALPLLALYEISIIIAKRREKAIEAERKSAVDPTNPNNLPIEEWQAQQKAKLMKDLNISEAEYQAMIDMNNDMFGGV